MNSNLLYVHIKSNIIIMAYFFLEIYIIIYYIGTYLYDSYILYICIRIIKLLNKYVQYTYVFVFY